MIESFNRRLLIYIPENKLKPSGGMAGYNYALRAGLVDINASNYSYLPSVETIQGKIYNNSNSFFKRTVSILMRVLYYAKLLLMGGGTARVNLNDYDVVHFHNAKDLYDSMKSLKSYKGDVVLTNHSPKPWSSELYDGITDFERKYFGWLYRRMTKVDKYAFDRADFIIFPCEDAEEPYYNNWIEYKSVHERNASKYHYLLTGTKACTARIDKATYRDNVGVSEDAFVVSYVGRHNKVKGYDILVELGRSLLQENNNYVLVAGSPDPKTVPDYEHWVEVGWTDDPHSLINCSDIFVLPNRETYFDLVMLEVLSLGAIVVASNTGGNKYFRQLNADGIFLYSSVEEALEIIERIKNLSEEERTRLRNSNKDLYNRYFTNEQFARSYIALINSLEKCG